MCLTCDDKALENSIDIEAIKTTFKRLKNVVPDWDAYMELSGEEARKRFEQACKVLLGDKE